MPQGTQSDNEKIYKIMAAYFETNNYNETSRITGIAPSTVWDTVERHRNEEEFIELQKKIRGTFAENATKIIEKGMELLSRRLNTAVKHEDKLDELIDLIMTSDQKEITPEEKQKLVSTIRSLQVQRLGDITTAIGTLYDKRALALGESTENITFTLPEGAKRYAE